MTVCDILVSVIGVIVGSQLVHPYNRGRRFGRRIGRPRTFMTIGGDDDEEVYMPWSHADEEESGSSGENKPCVLRK